VRVSASHWLANVAPGLEVRRISLVSFNFEKAPIRYQTRGTWTWSSAPEQVEVFSKI
jgi:hypothetical protein